jgi:ribose transport system ATP-binding protein
MNKTKKAEERVYFEVKGIQQKYPGIHALKGIDLKINRNDIIGFAGENGAGKSTLLRIISGVEKPYKGEMKSYGSKYSPLSFREANLLGVSMVFQEQNLVPDLSVYENLFLSHEERFQKSGILNRRRMINTAAKYLAKFELELDPKMELLNCSFHEKQMLEIIRAFAIADIYHIETPLILLDEPTAGLPERERELLLNNIKSFTSRATFIFVSHRLSELMSTCNRIVVLKDGEFVGEVDPNKTTEKDIHPMMVGRTLSGDTYDVEHQKPLQDIELEDSVLQVSGLSSKNEYDSVDIKLRPGEILGVGGLLGSGKKALGEILFGVGEHDEGQITVNGKVVEKPNIRKMIQNKIGYVPSERKDLGIIDTMDVTQNLSLPNLKELNKKFIFLDKRKENSIVEKGIKQFRIKAKKDDLCYSLSGGNQQKIVLTKWMIKDLNILILNNPTRGIDIGAKEEIYTFIREAAKRKLAILLITDDLLELIGLSNRIIIMKDGVIASEFVAEKGQKPSEEELVRHMV